MTIGESVSNHVIDALKRIAVANGYQTDAGVNVHRGRRPTHISETAPGSLPAIVVRCEASPTSSAQPRRAIKRREISVTCVALVASDDYEATLDALAEDIDRALLGLTHLDAQPAPITGIEMTGPEYTHPEPGSNLCAVTFTVSVSYVLTLKED